MRIGMCQRASDRRLSDNKGSIAQMDRKKVSGEEERMAKWEEGGRMSISHIDVSMNAPIRHQRPRHSCKNKLCPRQSAE